MFKLIDFILTFILILLICLLVFFCAYDIGAREGYQAGIDYHNDVLTHSPSPLPCK